MYAQWLFWNRKHPNNYAILWNILINTSFEEIEAYGKWLGKCNLETSRKIDKDILFMNQILFYKHLHQLQNKENKSYARNDDQTIEN